MAEIDDDRAYNLFLEVNTHTDMEFSLFSQCLRAKPDHPDCHANVAIQLLKRGQNVDALRHVSEAVSIMPDGISSSCFCSRSFE